MTERRIRRARGWVLAVPMKHPVRLGPMTYHTRDYAVLEVESDDGLIGRAIGYTRGTPLLAAARSLVRASGDADITDPVTTADLLQRRHLPGWAQYIRAASLLDICLWDIAAQASRQTISEALGTSRDAVEMMAVAGYFADVRDLAAIVDEACGFVHDGVRRVKAMLNGGDIRADASLVAALRSALPDDVSLGVDCHAAFGSASEAADYIRSLGSEAIEFVEDPFPVHEWRRYRRLTEIMDIPLAAGEDVTSMSAVADLLPWINYLRVDATASGGLSWARTAADLAQASGVIVAPHVFPYVHAALAANRASVSFAEYIPDQVGAEPISQIAAFEGEVSDGSWRHAAVPGLGIHLRYEAFDRHVIEEFAHE